LTKRLQTSFQFAPTAPFAIFAIQTRYPMIAANSSWFARLAFVTLVSLSSCDESPVSDVKITKPEPTLEIALVSLLVPNDVTVFVDVPSFDKPVIEQGAVFSETGTPTINDLKQSEWAGEPGRHYYQVTDLKAETLYHMRAFVRFENGEILYSEEASTWTHRHGLISFEPESAWPGEVVSVTGESFSLSNTELYLNGQKYDCSFHASGLAFKVPAGLDTDSVSIGVKVGGLTLVFPRKLHYQY
jgi:hypothetical protein